jgi:hypothetical protein
VRHVEGVHCPSPYGVELSTVDRVAELLTHLLGILTFLGQQITL